MAEKTYRKNLQAHTISHILTIYVIPDKNLQMLIRWERILLLKSLGLPLQLNDLSEKQRFVIIQKYIIGFSDVEIAERMNISRQAVNRLINRALENLRNNSKVKIYEGG